MYIAGLPTAVMGWAEGVHHIVQPERETGNAGTEAWDWLPLEAWDWLPLRLTLQ